MKAKLLLIGLLIVGTVSGWAQTCEIQYINSVELGNNYWPQTIYDKGTHLYVLGWNYLASINNSIPSIPYWAGTTESFSFACGDDSAVALYADSFPGDKMLFLATMCKGIRSYDTTQKNNPPSKAWIDFNNVHCFGAIVTPSGGRYLVLPAGNSVMYADYTNIGTASEVKTLESSAAIAAPQTDAMDGFSWNGKTYLAFHSRSKGFKLYDVSMFPLSATKIIDNPDLRSTGGFANGGRYYVNGFSGVPGASYGLHAYSIPSGSLLGVYTGRGTAEFSNARNGYADDQYAYLGLGSCTQTGGFDIVDISNPANMFSVLPAGFVPNACDNMQGVDLYATSGGDGSIYIFLSGHLTQDVYRLYNCGDYVNIDLQSHTPTAVDPGGTYPLYLTLKNLGNQTASNVTANLTESHSLVTVQAPTTVDLGTMNASQIKTATYNFTVDGAATAGDINFTLYINSSAGPFTENFTVAINPPRPILNRSVTKDVTSAVLVTYTNTGNADYTGSFNVTLTPWTKGVTFAAPTQSFGPIAKGTSQTKSFAYSIAGACTPVDFISLKVANTDASINNDPANLNVHIGGSSTHPLVLRSTSTLSKTAGVYTVSLTLQNQGNATATAASATLASTYPNLAWSTAMPVSFGDIAAGSSSTRTAQFTVPDGSTGTIDFTLSTASSQGCWSEAFSHSLTDVRFTYSDDERCSCTANCTFNPHPDIFEGSESGDSCYNFYFKLQNDGTSGSSSVPAYLSLAVADSNVNITAAASTYTVAAGTIGKNASPFTLYLNGNYCSGNDSTCPPLRLRLTIPEYGFSYDIPGFTVKSSGGSTTTYSISGTVSGDIQSGVGMVLSGAASSSTNTNTSGGYTFSNLLPGSYTVTPTKSGYTFSPASRSVTISSSNATGQNFTATGSGGTATLSYQSSSISDPAPSGDDDKVLDPGETVQLYVTLKNDSATAITAAGGTLTTTSSGVVISSQGSYTISAYKSAAAPFTVTVDKNYAATTASFRIAVAGATVTNPDFTVPVGGVAMPLSYQSHTINDGAEGDGIWQPGETVNLNVFLRNDGASTLTSAAGRLTTTATGVQIRLQGSYTLEPGQTGSATFNVFLPGTYADPAVPFTISVTGGSVTNPVFNVPVGSASGNTLVIPVVAHIRGANDTNWKSDLRVHNDGDQAMDFTLKLIKSLVTNDTPPEATFTLAAGATKVFDDLLDNDELSSFRGNILGSLLLEFTGTTAPSVTTRIYNDQGIMGTYGQSAPAIRADSRTRGTSGGVPSILFGLRRSGAYQTNLGLVNITDSWNELQITLRDASGVPLGNAISQTLAPYNMLQLNDILAKAGIFTEADGFTATVQSISGKDFVAYASISDGVTGDASYISDQIDAHQQSLVPGAGHTAGTAGSNWRTDLSIYNPDPFPVTVRITYFRYGYAGGGAIMRLGPIAAEGGVILTDVLAQFSGLGESEAGFLVVEPEHEVTTPPLVSARTYNDQGANGTYGQYIPSLDLASGGHSGQVMVIPGLSSNEQFRVNVGFINGDTDGVGLAVTRLYDTAGALLGEHEFYMPYNTMGLQISSNEFLSLMGITGSFENATLVVEANGDNLFVYASSADNLTNDPVYLLPAVH